MSEKSKSHGRLAIRPSLKPRVLMTDTPELENAWTVKVITLFPESFPGVLDRSLTGKALQEGLWQLQTIELRGFGTFSVKHRLPKKARNPKTGEKVNTPEKKTIHFKMAKDLFKKLNNDE